MIGSDSSRPGLIAGPADHGFTLLEVLVAVAVLAVAMGAIIASGGRYADRASDLRVKTLALWVAHNRLAEIEMTPSWPQTGTSSDDVEMGGRKWTWHVKVSATPDPTLRRVDVRVTPQGQDADNQASLTAFLSAYGRQRTPQ
ncbi:MAG: type II secretion system protein GspI [Nevskiaceae bacterium]|nr:MAG: type II secretion system protein GspI [Nevskiaceae bacterium]TBR74826.1 MAG: type II secretion system protein GspI [Nevskiaceae bacterium]